MATFNKVILVGNVTKDPELRYTPKGTALCNLTLAVNEKYTADNGEKRESVSFIEVTFWGRLAEIVGEYVKKGKPILVSGSLKQESWEDKTTGKKRSKLVVVADEMQLLGSREGKDRGQSTDRPSSRHQSTPKPSKDPDLDVEGSDIPF